MKQTVINHFQHAFARQPEAVVQSPGRINLIGEHTDYNGGYVMPAAIDKYIFAAVARRNDQKINVFSVDFNQLFQTDLKSLGPLQSGRWENYILGVVAHIQKHKELTRGFDMVITGNIPVGAGLSSSAALENAVAYALNLVFGLGLDRSELIKISQLAEHTYAGVKCGIMDQFASMFGKKEKFIFLNTQNLEHELIDLKLDQYSIILINTNVKHSLASSVYNKRRQLCELTAYKLGVRYLTDATAEQLQQLESWLKPEDYLAMQFVLEENQRVTEMKNAIKNLDFRTIGNLLYESHDGLSKKYRVSCAELDFLVEKAKEDKNILGARMMGGGFGGCTINLVKRGYGKEFFNNIKAEYEEKFGKQPALIEIEIVDGTKAI